MAEQIKPLGLVLCGGQSQRMGEDKSRMQYHRLPQWHHCAQLLEEFCDRVIISGLRGENEQESAYDWLADLPEFRGTGPVGGLCSAHAVFPGKGILVLGCDYPLLTRNALALLMDYANKGESVAFASPEDGEPEPLIAYYGSKLLDRITHALKQGEQSLRRNLIRFHVPLIEAPEPGALLNADTPEKAEIARVMLRSGFANFA